MIWGNITGLFMEGLLSFFSPCVLPLIPLYIGYLTKDTQIQDAEGNVSYNRVKTLILTIGFVLGICVVFVFAALSSTVLNKFFQNNKVIFLIVGGILLILMGLLRLDIIQIPFLNKTFQKNVKVEGKMTFLKAFVLGFFFSFAWSPCIGPMLATAIMQASSAESAVMGWIYILAFALGFIFLFLLIGLFTNTILNWLRNNKKIVEYTSIMGGLVVLGMGCYMMYQAFTYIQAQQTNDQKETIIEEGEIDTLRSIEEYNFSLEDAQGNTHNLLDYDGKTIIINFFGTWCYYCNQELPIFETIHKEMDDVKILLIATPNYDKEGDVDYIEEYMDNAGYTMDILYDTSLEVTRMFQITGYPTSFIIKPDGEFLGYIPGYLPEQDIRNAIDEARES